MTLESLAAELNDGYLEEAGLYAQVLGLAEQWSALPSGQDESAHLQLIGDLLAQVQNIEGRLRPLKAPWREASGSPSGTLAATLTHVADLIRAIQDRLDEVRRHTEQSHRELAPVLDDLIRRRQMRSAYGRLGAESPHVRGRQ